MTEVVQPTPEVSPAASPAETGAAADTGVDTVSSQKQEASGAALTASKKDPPDLAGFAEMTPPTSDRTTTSEAQSASAPPKPESVQADAVAQAEQVAAEPQLTDAQKATKEIGDLGLAIKPGDTPAAVRDRINRMIDDPSKKWSQSKDNDTYLQGAIDQATTQQQTTTSTEVNPATPPTEAADTSGTEATADADATTEQPKTPEQQQIDALKTENATLKAEIGSLKGEIGEMKELLEKAGENIKLLGENVKDLVKGIKENKGTKDPLWKKILYGLVVAALIAKDEAEEILGESLTEQIQAGQKH